MKSKIQGIAGRCAILGTVLTAVLLSFCSNLSLTQDFGGSSSEVVALVGGALNADNTAAARVTVRLRPVDYLSGSPAGANGNAQIADVETDAEGAFRIDSVKPGAYTIEIADGKSTGAVRTFPATLDGNEIHLEPMLLKPLAKLSGIARLPAGVTGPVYIMVYGLERRILADSTGGFTFNDLPEGRFSVRIAPAAETVGPCDVPDIIVAHASAQTMDTVILRTFAGEDYSAWASSRTIRINTSLSGADVAATVTGFPLLVRLDASNFDFSVSLSYKPGTDVRFAGPDGRHLPCQIERWDPALHKAEIWVRPDTIFGNDSAQFIRMYCGKASAASWTGAGVFDTAAGFAAVWHLGDDLDDATTNGNTGSSVNTSIAEGIIGACRYFDGSSSFIGIGSSVSLNMAGRSPTILLWERGPQQAYAREQMFFEHDVWPNTGDYGFSTRSSTTLSFDFPSADSEVRSGGKPVSDDAWHLVAAVKDDPGGRGVVYYDGDSVASGPMRSAVGSSDGPSFIGSRGGTGRFFEGYIDEVWILSRPLSGDFIKLSYENQRPGQTMISVR